MGSFIGGLVVWALIAICAHGLFAATGNVADPWAAGMIWAIVPGVLFWLGLASARHSDDQRVRKQAEALNPSPSCKSSAQRR